MSYQQCTIFRTTLDFDREFLWNGSSNPQLEKSVIIYDISYVRLRQLGKRWSIKEKNDLDL